MMTANLFTSQLQEISITYRNKMKVSEMPHATSSQDVFDLLQNIWSDKIGYVEEFMVLCLNRGNRVLGWSLVGTGGLSGVVADPKVIFQVALKSNASSIIVAHNHPSGTLKPSDADRRLTSKILQAGQFLDISVLDHLIITPDDRYYSFADEGTLTIMKGGTA